MATTAFVAGYLVQALSGLVDVIKPVRWVSPLHHANGTIPINTGFPIWHYMLLVGLCAILAIGAVQLFGHRDVVS